MQVAIFFALVATAFAAPAKVVPISYSVPSTGFTYNTGSVPTFYSAGTPVVSGSTFVSGTPVASSGTFYSGAPVASSGTFYSGRPITYSAPTFSGFPSFYSSNVVSSAVPSAVTYSAAVPSTQFVGQTAAIPKTYAEAGGAKHITF